MIVYFLLGLFLTLTIVRLAAHLLHDIDGYGTQYEKSKTLTGYLRKKTGFDLHHIHFGFILLIILIVIYLLYEINELYVSLLAVSLSLIFDQILPWLKLGDYFSQKMLSFSIIFHMLIAITALYIF